MRARNVILTEGSIWKKLLQFFLPILAGSLFQQLYTTMDAVIVGQFAGMEGLAAIDSVYNLIKLPVNFFIGLSTGATILISQYFGAENKTGLSTAAHTAIAFSFIGGLALSILGILAAPLCIRLMNVPQDIYELTLAYVRIYFCGLSVSMTYNIGAGILRAVGDSQTPFAYLMISSIVNVLLDLLFVGVMGMSVIGAALSTVIAQLLSAILVIRALMRTKLDCRLVLRKVRMHWPVLQPMLALGVPIAVKSSLYPIANMLIQSTINSMGTNSIAAWALCGKLDFPVWLVIDSLAAAVSTFVAQNYGAKQYERVRKGVRICLSMTVGIILIISIVLYLGSEPLGRLILRDEDGTVIALTGQLMRFLSPMYVFYVFGAVLSGAVCGAGETMKPMVLTLAGTCLSRVLWILLAVPQSQTMVMIIACYPVSWALTTVIFAIFYQIFRRRHFQSASADA